MTRSTLIAWLRPQYIGRRREISGWILTITDTSGNIVLSDQEFTSEEQAEKRLAKWVSFNPTTQVVRKNSFGDKNYLTK